MRESANAVSVVNIDSYLRSQYICVPACLFLAKDIKVHVTLCAFNAFMY